MLRGIRSPDPLDVLAWQKVTFDCVEVAFARHNVRQQRIFPVGVVVWHQIGQLGTGCSREQAVELCVEFFVG